MTKSKVIKLNGRYKLYKEGNCTHAVRYPSWSKEASELERFFRERYGGEYSWNQKPHMWRTHWGKSKDGTSRPYYIGVRDEQMIFVAKLAGII